MSNNKPSEVTSVNKPSESGFISLKMAVPLNDEIPESGTASCLTHWTWSRRGNFRS